MAQAPWPAAAKGESIAKHFWRALGYEILAENPGRTARMRGRPGLRYKDGIGSHFC